MKSIFAILTTVSTLALLGSAGFGDAPFSEEAIRLMRDNDYEIQDSLSSLMKLTNRFQVEAIEVLATHTDENNYAYDIDDKFPALLRFNNEFSVSGLTHLIENEYDVSANTFKNLAQLRNPFQIEAIEILATNTDSDNYQYEIDDNFPAILQFSSELGVRALDFMVRDEREINHSIKFLPQLTNGFQLEALEVMLDGRDADDYAYDIDDAFPALLEINNPFAVRAIKALVENNLPLTDLASIAKINSELQAVAIETEANETDEDRNIREITKLAGLEKNLDPLKSEALNHMIRGGLDTHTALLLLPQVTTQHEVDVIARLAEHQNFNTSIHYAFSKPNALQLDFLAHLLDEEIGTFAFENAANQKEKIKYAEQLELLQEVSRLGYDVEANLKYILEISNPHQVALAEFVMQKGLSLSKVMTQILKVTTLEQTYAVMKKINHSPIRTYLAVTLKKSHPAFWQKNFDALLLMHCRNTLEKPI